MPRATYVAAIDQGTTCTRCMLFDHGGKVVGSDQKEHQQIYPRPGWVEHDPEEIWQRTQEVVQGALTKTGVEREQLAAVGITNQRETTLLWYRATGKPVYNAIVWQDTRTDHERAGFVVVNVRDTAARPAAEQLLMDLAQLRKDDSLLKDILGWRGNRTPITALVANISDPRDAGRRKAVARARRTIRSQVFCDRLR